MQFTFALSLIMAVGEVTVIDDFESYTDEFPNEIWATWIDGFAAPAKNGSVIGNPSHISSLMETVIVHGGNQSAPFHYDNSSGQTLSEVTRDVGAIPGWNAPGLELQLWFYGRAFNDPDQMYLRLASANGNTATVLYDNDVENVKNETWQCWHVPIAEFGDQGIDLSDMSQFTFGIGSYADPPSGATGRILLDDIELISADSIVALQPGDADRDHDFDQFDIIRVLRARKYRTGQSATWGEGDWNGAPGGRSCDPPVGDGIFDQFDLVAALQAGFYLQGPYAALHPTRDERMEPMAHFNDDVSGHFSTNVGLGENDVPSMHSSSASTTSLSRIDNWEPTYVPEPSAIVLFILGAAILLSRRNDLRP